MFYRESTARQLSAELCSKCHVSISCYGDNDGAGGAVVTFFNPLKCLEGSIIIVPILCRTKLWERANNLPTVSQLDNCRTERQEPKLSGSKAHTLNHCTMQNVPMKSLKKIIY